MKDIKSIELLTHHSAQPVKGDKLLVHGNFKTDSSPQVFTVQEVKIVSPDYDSVEIILRKRGNIYFNYGMYLDGMSWVCKAYRLNLKP